MQMRTQQTVSSVAGRSQEPDTECCGRGPLRSDGDSYAFCSICWAGLSQRNLTVTKELSPLSVRELFSRFSYHNMHDQLNVVETTRSLGAYHCGLLR